jgi:ornithine cyclodeaminase
MQPPPKAKIICIFLLIFCVPCYTVYSLFYLQEAGIEKGGGEMLLLSKDDIRRVFSMTDAIRADKEAFRLFSAGQCEVPLRTQIKAPKYDGTFLFMPAYIPALDYSVEKIVNIFPRNSGKNIPTAPAQVLLIDGTNGMIAAILDGMYLTQLRTGAASGAAFDLLARRECRKGTVIGTGSQAAAQVEAMLTVRILEQINVFDRNPRRAEQFAQQMRASFPYFSGRIVASSSVQDAVCDADLLITVTSAETPVFDGTLVKAGATVSCVGAYQPRMQEMDPRLLYRASKIYFDSQEAVLAEAGDIIIPLREGIITENDFTGELGEVVAGTIPARESENEIIVFKTVGIAAQDLVTAMRIYDKSVAAGIGTQWL